MPNHIVSVIRIHEGDVKNAVFKAIEALGGINIPPNCNVVIKPNLCTFMGSETGATTDIRIIEALIEFINNQERINKIFVVESKSFSGSAPNKFKRLGYAELEEKYDNVKLVNLDKDEIYSARFNENDYLKNVEIPETFLASNYFISVAKLKTSTLQGISCVLKNQFGCISGGKGKYHPWLSQVITDINYVLRPDLCIIDGIYAMEGKGPTEGTPKKMNLIIAGRNPVAVDSVAARIMGFDPASVPHLKRAAKRGLGSIKNVEVVGKKIDEVKEAFRFIPMYAYVTLRLCDSIQRMSDRLHKFSKFVYLGGIFLGDVKKYWVELKRLSLPQIKSYIEEGRVGE